MPPRSKRAAHVADASVTPAPVDPQAASPIHSACARRADAHGGLSQTAVREVLREVGFQGILEHTTRGAHIQHFRDKYLTSVAEKCGVPLFGDLVGRGGDRVEGGGGQGPLRLEHVLYIVWEQVARAMDDVDAHTTRGEETAVATLGRNLVLAAVSAENPAFADAFGEALPVEECVEKIRAIVDMSLGGAPVEELDARELLSTVVPVHFTPSLFVAYTWCLSKGAVALVGSSAAPVLRRQAFHDALARPAPDEDLAALNTKLLADVMAFRREMRKPAPVDEDLVRPSKMSRASGSQDFTDKMKTLSIELAQATKTALRNVPETIARATRFSTLLLHGEGAGFEEERTAALAAARAIDETCSRQALARHTLVVADALQLLLRDRLTEARGTTFHGVGICSDESPPRTKRFSGYRFQITWVYVPFIPSVDAWALPAYDERAPVTFERYLLDIVHCPGKDGASVMHVLEKQLDRIGLGRYDVFSGTGDGGGENEGANGIHATFEEAMPGYVRRRCLGHISWRSAEAGFPSMGNVREGWKAISRHLHEGGVWARLKIAATASVDYGGLALYAQGSRAYAAVFGQAPPTVINDRPETDLRMAEWLLPRMHILPRLVQHDQDARVATARRDDAGRDATQARQALLDDTFRARLPICAEVLRRALYLHRWVNKHPHVAAARHSSLRGVFEEAIALITDVTTVDDEFLVAHRLTRADLAARGWAHMGWVEIAVRHG